MALAVPQMIGLLAGGGIVTVWGQYVSSRETFPARQGLTVLVQMPVILFAQVLCAIGSGLLTTLRTDTSTALWGTYLALTGLGLGLGVNVPHIAIQAVMKTSVLSHWHDAQLTEIRIILLRDNDIFIANGI